MKVLAKVGLLFPALLVCGCLSNGPPLYSVQAVNRTQMSIYHSAVAWGDYPIGGGGIAPGTYSAYVAISAPIPGTATVSWTDVQDNKHSVVISVAPRPSREMNVFTIEIQPDGTVKSYWRQLGAGLPNR